MGGEHRRIDRPRMELYRRAQADTLPERLVTDLCVPLGERRPEKSGPSGQVTDEGLAKALDDIDMIRRTF